MKQSPPALEDLRFALKAACSDRPVARVEVFGSLARGVARVGSDVDLLIEFLPGASVGLFEMGALKEELEERLGCSVDLLSRRAVEKAAMPSAAKRSSPTRLRFMRDERQSSLLRDILESALNIRSYLEGVSRDRFLENVEKQDAVLRRLEIIGEAASRLSVEARALFPNLPFRSMRGMRNIIAHDYGDVDIEQVWTTVEADLPELIETLRDHFA